MQVTLCLEGCAPLCGLAQPAGSCRYLEPQFGTFRHRCAGDSRVEAHAQRNLTHDKPVNTTDMTTPLPASDLGGKGHPTGCGTERIPSGGINRAAIKLHFGPPSAYCSKSTAVGW